MISKRYIATALFVLFAASIAWAAIDQWAGQDISGLDQIAGANITGLDQWAGQDLPGGSSQYTYDFAGSGALSSDWTQEIDESGGNCTIVRNSGIGQIDTTYGGIQVHIYVWQSNQLPDDQTITIDYAAGTATAQNRPGACGRMSITGAGNGYCFVQRTDNSAAEIYRYDSGTPTQLTYTTTPAANLTIGSTLKIVFSGSQITGFVDDTQILTASDSTYSTGYGGWAYTSNPGDLGIDNWVGQ